MRLVSDQTFCGVPVVEPASVTISTLKSRDLRISQALTEASMAGTASTTVKITPSSPLILYHMESPTPVVFVLYHIESPGLV